MGNNIDIQERKRSYEDFLRLLKDHLAGNANKEPNQDPEELNRNFYLFLQSFWKCQTPQAHSEKDEDHPNELQFDPINFFPRVCSFGSDISDSSPPPPPPPPPPSDENAESSRQPRRKTNYKQSEVKNLQRHFVEAIRNIMKRVLRRNWVSNWVGIINESTRKKFIREVIKGLRKSPRGEKKNYSSISDILFIFGQNNYQFFQRSRVIKIKKSLELSNPEQFNLLCNFLKEDIINYLGQKSNEDKTQYSYRISEELNKIFFTSGRKKFVTATRGKSYTKFKYYFMDKVAYLSEYHHIPRQDDSMNWERLNAYILNDWTELERLVGFVETPQEQIANLNAQYDPYGEDEDSDFDAIERQNKRILELDRQMEAQGDNMNQEEDVSQIQEESIVAENEVNGQEGAIVEVKNYDEDSVFRYFDKKTFCGHSGHTIKNPDKTRSLCD